MAWGKDKKSKGKIEPSPLETISGGILSELRIMNQHLGNINGSISTSGYNLANLEKALKQIFVDDFCQSDSFIKSIKEKFEQLADRQGGEASSDYGYELSQIRHAIEEKKIETNITLENPEITATHHHTHNEVVQPPPNIDMYGG